MSFWNFVKFQNSYSIEQLRKVSSDIWGNFRISQVPNQLSSKHIWESPVIDNLWKINRASAITFGRNNQLTWFSSIELISTNAPNWKFLQLSSILMILMLKIVKSNEWKVKDWGLTRNNLETCSFLRP